MFVRCKRQLFIFNRLNDSNDFQLWGGTIGKINKRVNTSEKANKRRIHSGKEQNVPRSACRKLRGCSLKIILATVALILKNLFHFCSVIIVLKYFDCNVKIKCFLK